MIAVNMTVAADTVEIPAAIGATYVMSSSPAFEGPYEYTPTADTQTINIEGYRAIEPIIINPIPSNYGLIQWNGSVLSVS